MEAIDQLSTYIYLYVDGYQNYMYVREKTILFLSQIEFLPIYSMSSIQTRLNGAVARFPGGIVS